MRKRDERDCDVMVMYGRRGNCHRLSSIVTGPNRVRVLGLRKWLVLNAKESSKL